MVEIFSLEDFRLPGVSTEVTVTFTVCFVSLLADLTPLRGGDADLGP
jgi:hypothetical protein